jgi:SAM-dependent methyltransferase
MELREQSSISFVVRNPCQGIIPMKKFLHVGCGKAKMEHTTIGFNDGTWQEIRFDIDPNCSPDIVGTITNMENVSSGSVDAIFSSHNLEHVYPHEVGPALREFLRVLSDDGFIILTCPDLQSVCSAVANNKLLEPLYQSPAGPIAAIDILFGHRASVSKGQNFMAHKCGFTYSVLSNEFLGNGFASIIGGARPLAFDLWIAAFKKNKTADEMKPFAEVHFPK